MRHLGILAHSVEGAALCLRAFCQEGFRELGPHDHPDVTLDCIALARSMPAWDAGDHAAVRAVLARGAHRLAQSGAHFFVCPDNTAHIALEQPGDDLALPGLNIAEVVAERAALDRRQRVGILGTRYTMDGPVYPRALGARGMVAELPAEAERRIVDRIIFDELVAGIFSDASRREYVHIIERLRDRGCDAVALVCTEIPLLVTPEDSPLPTLDSTRLLARAAFEVAAGGGPCPRGGGDRSGTRAQWIDGMPAKKSIAPELKVLPFATSRAFAAWLAKNHAKSRGLWIRFAKTASGIASIRYPEALEAALSWGWIDGQSQRIDDIWYVQRFTPRGPRSLWSKLNCAKAIALIAAGAMRPAGLAEVERAKADGRWARAYDSPSRATVPDDLTAELAKNARASQFFSGLDARNRYAVLHRVQTAKKADTRARRIAEFVKMLARREKLYP